jgi:hypothetical protein
MKYLITRVASLVLLMSCAAMAEMPLASLPANPSYLMNPHFDIYVVRVTVLRSGYATNSDPPTGQVEIEVTLRGRVDPGRYSFRIAGPVRHSDLDGQGTMTRQWYDTELDVPKLGSRLIVFGRPNYNGDTLVLQDMRIEYNATNRRIVLETMAPAERIWWVQLPIALLVCFMPVLSLFRWSREKIWRVPALMSGGALLMYFFYECGISSYSNIRVDLLLLGPAVLLNAALLLYFLVKRRGSG